MKESTTRNTYLDFVKGIAIFLMLLGHCIQYGTVDTQLFFNNPLFRFIYSFHMPLFMIISGYLFYYSLKKHNLKEILKGKIKSLGIPLLIFGGIPVLIQEIFSYVMGKEISIIGFIKTIYNTINGLTTFWFIWAVLICSITFCIVVKLQNCKYFNLFFSLLISFLVIWILPGRRNNLFMYPFFLIGYYGHYFDEKKKLKKNIQIVCIVIFALLIFFYNNDSYIYTSGLYITNFNFSNISQLWIDLYRYIIGLTGSISALTILRIIYNKDTKCNLYIETIGKVSLQIYILQHFIVEYGYKNICKLVVQHLGYNPLTQNMILFNLVLTPLFAIIFAVIIERIVYITQKTKLSKILFGR